MDEIKLKQWTANTRLLHIDIYLHIARKTLYKTEMRPSNKHTHAKRTDMQSYGNNKLNKICIKSIKLFCRECSSQKEKRKKHQLTIEDYHKASSRNVWCNAEWCDVMWCDSRRRMWRRERTSNECIDKLLHLSLEIIFKPSQSKDLILFSRLISCTHCECVFRKSSRENINWKTFLAIADEIRHTLHAVPE